MVQVLVQYGMIVVLWPGRLSHFTSTLGFMGLLLLVLLLSLARILKFIIHGLVSL